MAKVSIIIPVYNVEKYLRECLDSILSQSLKDIEIICIDDGSKDTCPTILDEYAQRDSRIKVIHKENGGYGHSCNVGLKNATGEYIAIVEPDDFVDKNMYLDLYTNAVKNNADIVKSGYIENYDLDKASFKKIKPDLKNFGIKEDVFTIHECPELMLIHPSIWSCIYKKEFLDEYNIRFIEAPGAGWTDNPFQVQVMCLAKRITYVNKAYYYWRKLNLDDANDLKDITIPFKRTAEIRRFIADNNINDSKIISFLYKREIAYIHLVNRIIKKEQFSQYKELLGEYTSNLDWELIKHSSVLKNKEKKFLYQIRKHPIPCILKDKFIYFKAKLLKFRYCKNEKYLYLFKKRIFRKEPSIS